VEVTHHTWTQRRRSGPPCHYRRVDRYAGRLRRLESALVVWDRSPDRSHRGMSLLWGFSAGRGWGVQVLTDADPTAFTAFCLGTMPGYAFADWLEERQLGLPPEAFELLRAAVNVHGGGVRL
jgi:hypothetical protein